MKGAFDMKVLWIFMLIAFVVGMLSKVMIASIYASMTKENTENPLIKQIRLKYDNCKKLDISINNVNAFVEKSMENYRICGLSLNGINNISKEMQYICVGLGIINAIVFRQDTSAIVFGLGISLLSCIAIKLLEEIVDTDNQKRSVVVELVDYLDNTSVHRDSMKDMAVKRFSKEASTEFNKLNKSFEKIESSGAKTPVDNSILEEILEEYLT